MYESERSSRISGHAASRAPKTSSSRSSIASSAATTLPSDLRARSYQEDACARPQSTLAKRRRDGGRSGGRSSSAPAMSGPGPIVSAAAALVANLSLLAAP